MTDTTGQSPLNIIYQQLREPEPFKAMTSRFEAWAVKEGFGLKRIGGIAGPYASLATSGAFLGWQAAQHDMLERAIELIQSQPDGSYRAELITAGMLRNLKELLNEQGE